MAQWLERRTGDRGVLGSNPGGAASEFGDSVYPTLPVSFGGDTKSSVPGLLSGVYSRGRKIPHTGGKCVTCCGLHNFYFK